MVLILLLLRNTNIAVIKWQTWLHGLEFSTSNEIGYTLIFKIFRTGHSRSPQSPPQMQMQPMISRAQIPLPAIPYHDIPYQDLPVSPVAGQGALSGVGVFTSLPILEPLNDQFRRASMRRRSSKR